MDEAIQDVMELPETLQELKPHSYGTIVCVQPVEFEHGELAFGHEELMPIKIVGPEAVFQLVVELFVGRSSDAKKGSELAEAEAMRFDY
jgi:hypothetical protein